MMMQRAPCSPAPARSTPRASAVAARARVAVGMLQRAPHCCRAAPADAPTAAAATSNSSSKMRVAPGDLRAALQAHGFLPPAAAAAEAATAAAAATGDAAPGADAAPWAGGQRDALIGMVQALHGLLDAQLRLQAAPTAVSDAGGVFVRTAPQADPADPATPRLLTLTMRPSDALSSSTDARSSSSSGGSRGGGSGSGGSGSSAHASAPAALVDWSHHTLGSGPSHLYAKCSVFSADTSLLPHFEAELGASPGSDQILLYVSMDPKRSLTLCPGYLDAFYLTAPPSADVGAGGTGQLSWAQLEAQASAQPGFVRFTSPDLHVRAFSSTAILFKVAKQPGSGWQGAQDVLLRAAELWMRWYLAAAAAAGAGAGAAGAPGEQQQAAAATATTGAQPPGTTAAAEFVSDDPGVAARSWAWRRFPRRDRAAGSLRLVFGAAAMEDYWDNIAGEARIRL